MQCCFAMDMAVTVCSWSTVLAILAESLHVYQRPPAHRTVLVRDVADGPACKTPPRERTFSETAMLSGRRPGLHADFHLLLTQWLRSLRVVVIRNKLLLRRDRLFVGQLVRLEHYGQISFDL